MLKKEGEANYVNHQSDNIMKQKMQSKHTHTHTKPNKNKHQVKIQETKK